jgi:hypothetical protein
VVAGAAFAVPTALAASPQDAARSFSAGETALPANLANAALDNPTVQGYESPTQVVEIQNSATPGGVLGANKTIAKASPAARNAAPGSVATARVSNLPFTGVDLGIFLAVGLALVGGGLLVRRANNGKR